MTDNGTGERWPWWCMWGALAVVGMAALGYRMEDTFGPIFGAAYTGDEGSYTFDWGWPLVLLALALGLVGLCGMVWQVRKRR